MNRYWDLSEQERAKLTTEQVEAMLVVELMEKGVVKVEKPTLEPVEEIKLGKTGYFEIQRRGEYGMTGTCLLFTDAVKAKAFIELQPLWEDSRYEYGHDRKFAMPGRELTIKSVELPTELEVVNMAGIISKNKAAEEANKTKLAEYTKAIKAVDDAVKGVWDDWHTCRAKARDAAKVKDTLIEYLGLCDGNTTAALAFLGKAFDEERIAEAKVWFGPEWNVQDMADALPA